MTRPLGCFVATLLAMTGYLPIAYWPTKEAP